MKRPLAWIALVILSSSVNVSWGQGYPPEVVFDHHSGVRVVFSHEEHVKRVGLACERCHPSPYAQDLRGDPVTMADLHEGKSCGLCHNGKESFTTKGNCSKCHK
jgi:c(7)-type cytochrome triheme protein